MIARSPEHCRPKTVEPTQPLLEVTDLKVHFSITKGLVVGRRVGTVRAVDGVSFWIKRGEALGLVGESGCGKTTTGRALVRLDRPTGGSIRFDGHELVGLKGEPLRRLRKRFQMVFQDPYSSLNPRMNVRSIIAEPLESHGVGTPKERRDRVDELLHAVGLPLKAADRFPHQFSGGQRQRIGIARALALHPDLVVADEPISALDVSIQAQIINLLQRLQREFHLTYLVIAHDLAAVRHMSDRVAVMYLGRIIEVGPPAELYRAPRHPYTVALLSAVPLPNPDVEAQRQRVILRGDVPSAAAPPPGCRFHSRCWLYERLGRPDECTRIEPPLRELRTGRSVACHFSDVVDDPPAS